MSISTEELKLKGPIAVSMSGGGGRAAAFHLGTLSTLHRLGLLKHVSIMSSVSGGTFTAAKYALTLKKAPEDEGPQATFERFFDDFYDFLLHADLVPKATKRLTGPPPATPSPRRTIVKALADVYDQTFMEGALFEEILGGREIHLKNIIFNSTECKDGRAFRFQKTDKLDRIGNPKVWIDSQHARWMRLADVVAASSDIPVGLEPLLFPQDFVWPAEQPGLWLDVQGHLKDSFGIDTLPLMDGGVIDNQGIEGVMLAARTRSDKEKMEDWVEGFIPSEEEIGLYIISDVPERETDIYRPNLKASMKTLGPGSWLTVGRVNILSWVFILIAAGTIAQHVFYAITNWPLYGDSNWSPLNFLYLFVLLVPASGLIGLIGILLWFNSVLKKILRAASPEAPHLWKHLRLLTMDDLIYMFQSRLTSTWSLTSTIFLNRIRKLMYYAIHSAKTSGGSGKNEVPPSGLSPSGPASEDISSRLVICAIDDLAPEKLNELNLTGWLEPSGQMIELAARATKTPTTLWLTKEQLDVLVACGQITMYCTLLDHLMKNPPKKSQLGDQFFERGRQQWEALKEDGMAFLPQSLHSRKDSASPTKTLKAAGGQP